MSSGRFENFLGPSSENALPGPGLGNPWNVVSSSYLPTDVRQEYSQPTPGNVSIENPQIPAAKTCQAFCNSPLNRTATTRLMDPPVIAVHPTGAAYPFHERALVSGRLRVMLY